MSYSHLLSIHIGAVMLSGLLFLIRGASMVSQADWHRRGPWRVLPHVVDSVLLAAAIGLIVMLNGQPLGQPWLYAKLIGLVVYIVLGSIALKRGRSYHQRQLAFFGAVLVFTYIVGVALNRSPTSWVFG